MKKKIKISILIVVACFCFLVVPVAWFIHVGNEFFAEIGAIRELERIQSPDGLVDGVIVEWGGGAMNPDWYAVYVVPTNYKVTKDTVPQVFLGRHGKAFGIRWLENKSISIEDACDTVHFRPSVEPLKDNRYKVTVTLGLPGIIEDKTKEKTGN
jgi:hypothetical protein